MGKHDFSRRGFIAGGAVAGAAALVPTSVEYLMNALSSSFIRKAHAEANGMEGARNYINISMPGGPIRYAFDHWLRTNTSDPAMAFNPMITNRFTSSGGVVNGLEYSTFNYNGVLVPHMFSHSVFNGANAQRPLTDLLNNMLVIRGYASGFDGHSFNATIQQSPVGGLSSVMGLAADYSAKTFEAVEWPARGNFGSFSSSRGKSLNVLSSQKPLHALLEGFSRPKADSIKGRSLKERHRDAFDLAQARLKAYSQSDNAGAVILGKNLSNAVEMMKKGTGNIESYWPEALARYRRVMENSMRQSNLLGVSDAQMISAQTPMWKLHISAGNRGAVLANTFDARLLISQMQPPAFLIEGLALAEYILKENMASTLNIQPSELIGLLAAEVGGGLMSQNGPFDMHETGAFPAVLVATALYRGLAAGLLELIDQLKNTTVNGVDVWSETVVQLLSEFDRTGRDDGSGSDHGFNQMVTSAFSGAIKNGPFVVGNIYRMSSSGGYTGSQGQSAPIEGYTQAGVPNPTMAASTIAELLRVPKNPYENLAAPLIRLSGQQLQVLKTAKIIG